MILKRYAIIGILFPLFISPFAYGVESVIPIRTDEMGVHVRPVVTFPHERHENEIECNRCHHDYDESGNNVAEDEGGTCNECHIPKAAENPIPLMNAFHQQCKDCHQAQLKSGKVNLPMMCGQCHNRKPSP